MARFFGGIVIAALVAFGVVMCTVSVVGCSDGPERSRTCIEYASKLVLVCEHQHSPDEGGGGASDCPSLYEQGYNACNLALESGVPVCVPVYSIGGCDGYVYPPAPKNWKGDKPPPDDDRPPPPPDDEGGR